MFLTIFVFSCTTFIMFQSVILFIFVLFPGVYHKAQHTDTTHNAQHTMHNTQCTTHTQTQQTTQTHRHHTHNTTWCEHSGSDVEWLLGKSSLDLSIVARLGDHSAPRTYRGKERFPYMTFTYALILVVEKIAERSSPKCDGAEYGRWSVFDECMDFLRKNGSF